MEFDALLSVYESVRDALQALLTQSSPLLFFTLMAVLPIFGAPIAIFLVFSGRYGWDVALVGVVLAAVTNLSLSYLIAHSLARPLLQRLIRRTRYRVPTVTPDNQFQVLLIMRLTPGIPYALQNYVLGMTRMPFWLYLWFSLLVILAWALAFTILGESFFSGRPLQAAAGLLLIVGLGLLAHYLVRRARRETPGEVVLKDAD